MKCTARDIVDLHQALTVYGGLNLLPQTVLPFSRIQRAVRAEAETIAEARERLVQQHLLLDADSKPIEIALPNGTTDRKVKDLAVYNKAIKEFMASPVEIPGDQIPFADLIRGEVNSTLVAALHWVFKD